MPSIFPFHFLFPRRAKAQHRMPAGAPEIPNQASESRPPAQRYKVRSGIYLPRELTPKLTELSQAFYDLTGKSIEITSGYRSPEAQARAMYSNRKRRGRPFTSQYRQYAAAAELEKTYVKGIQSELSPDAIQDNLARTLRSQIEDGVFISDHMRKSAVDVSFHGLSSVDKRIFLKVASAAAQKILMEDTHFHCEFS